MNNIEISVISLGLLIVNTMAWKSLSLFTLGEVRHIEGKDKKLADKIESWIAKRNEYNIIFQSLYVLLFSIFIMKIINEISPTPFSILNIIIISVVTVGCLEVIARIISFKINIFILSITIPIIEILLKTVFYPFIKLIKKIEKSNEFNSDEKVTAEDEILSLVDKDDEEQSQELEEDEKRMIKGIFDLDDTFVREIMVPRVDVVGIDIKIDIKDAKKEFIKSGHSRIPVYENSIDEIKGVIFAKDFLDDEKIENNNLLSLARKPIFIPETKMIDDLLDEFLKNHNHLAVVIDEYGGTAGIVTLEDIIEEIVGEIQDEYDIKDDFVDTPTTLPDGSFIIDGRMLIDDVNEFLDNEIPEDEDVDTIGGYICSFLGKIPEAGEILTINEHIDITILKADKRKILSLKIFNSEIK